MALRDDAGFIDPDIEALPLEIRVLGIPPDDTQASSSATIGLPFFPVRTSGSRSRALPGREGFAVQTAGGDQQMGVHIPVALMRGVDVDLHRHAPSPQNARLRTPSSASSSRRG